MFLVDHFKAYFQSRLTQLILIFITSSRSFSLFAIKVDFKKYQTIARRLS